jgi:signal transduction histidine kinase
MALVLTSVPLIDLFTSATLTDSPHAVVDVVVLGATVAVRRTHPLAAACVQALVFVTTPNFDDNFLPDSGLPIVLAVAYSCGAHAPRRGGLAAVVALSAAQQIGMGFSEFPNFEVYFTTLVPWWVGLQVDRRRQLVARLEERTAQLEAEQDAFARLAVRRERARIAHELHDIVAHHLAVIAVQAGAGRMASSDQRDGAGERLASIRNAGEQALGEMARLVDVLDEDRHARAGAERRLRVLLDEAAASGVEVRFTGPPTDIRLPPEFEDAAYRVVREALTNAMKHAPGATVHVRVEPHDDELEIEVSDEGTRSGSDLSATGSGLGLAGMRERIRSLGGTLEAGSDNGRGWRVTARIPMSARVAVPPTV